MRALAVTVSNRASAGVYEDKGGPLLVAGLREMGFETDGPQVVPDGEPVEAALRAAVAAGYDVVLTTGGTGISPMDLTPEMTTRVIDRQIPGIAESIRAYGREKVPTSALSRGLAGLAGRTLIVNLPGSTGGVKDGLAVLAPLLVHAVDQLAGGDHPRASEGERELNAGWQVELHEGEVTLRPIRSRDQNAWQEVSRRNRDWLRRWEATVPPAPPGRGGSRPSYRQMVRYLRGEAAAGRMLPFVVLHQGHLVGQLTVGGITWGSMCSANVGYWVDEGVAGRGIMPTAVALAVDHCFSALGLHRIEVCIRPENRPSRRVVEKLGFREEGVRPRYLHIDGDWRDHLVYALTVEEVPEGMLERWRSIRAAGPYGN